MEGLKRKEETRENIEEKLEIIEENDNKEENLIEDKQEELAEEKKEEIQDGQNEQEENENSKINFQLVNLKYISSGNKKEKIFIISVIAIIVVLVSSILAVIVVNSNKQKVEKEIIPEAPPEAIEEETKSNQKIPMYSEEASNRMQNIYVPGDGVKEVYLTFDDGPSKNITPQILEILKNEEVKATFFVLGSRVEAHPELVKQEYDEGHYIANHGYSHAYTSIYSSVEAVLEEYNHTEEIIKSAIENQEYSSHLFRFPGGSEGGKYAKLKNEAKALLKQNGIEFINWNSLTNDAVGKPTYESLVTDFLKNSERKRETCDFNA